MKGKKILIGAAAAALGMVAGVGTTAVETAQTIAEVNQTTIQQAQGQRAQANQGQQNIESKLASQKMIQQKYAGASPSRYGYMDYGMSPKECGLYLAITGKKKHNDRRNKHYSKMLS